MARADAAEARFFVAAGGVRRMVRAMKSKPILALIVRWLVLALGVTLAEKLVDGIECKDGMTLLVVVVLLSFLNAVLRPILILFSLPFILLTLGLGLVFINALLFMLVGKLVPGFEVAGFGSAFWGALIVGVTNFAMTLLMKRPPDDPGGPDAGKGGGGRPAHRERGGDVIDV